jgi:hypothetical protein
MTMPASGLLNLGGTVSPVSVAQELRLGLTSQISMNDTAVRTLADVSGSDTTWSMSSLYGKSYTLEVEYLVVAGGGGGGLGISDLESSGVFYSFGAGGGGAGGFLSNSTRLAIGTESLVSVGAGGFGETSPANSDGGSDSSFGLIYAAGGGKGGSFYSSAKTGGSGGGAGAPSAYVNPSNGGPGIEGQGNAGGNPDPNPARSGGSGGGGKSAAGATADIINGSAGGAGLAWLNGVRYSGGGGGGGSAVNASGGSAGAGGLGGGGNGGRGNGTGSVIPPTLGSINTGGGGGGGGATRLAAGTGKPGGSGIVIVRYAGTTTKATGGTITTAGGYTYHTFTSSGIFTVTSR